MAMQPRKAHHGSFFSHDDGSGMMSDILSTHVSDGRTFDVRSLLRFVEDILKRCNPSGVMAPPEDMEAIRHTDHDVMMEMLERTIRNIARELQSNYSDGTDDLETARDLFNIVSSYSWDAKAVLVLAAFALNYGDFWLTAQIYTTNHLAKSIAVLKQVPQLLMRFSDTIIKSRVDAINDLIKVILEMIHSLIEFYELSSTYITVDDSPAVKMANTIAPTGAYWTVRGVMLCNSEFVAIVEMGHEHATGLLAWELSNISSMGHKISNINAQLREKLLQCREEIEEKKRRELYQTLLHLFQTPQVDNFKVLKTLIYAKDDLLPLVDGSANKNRVGVEVLRRKTVMLFISDLDVAQEELSMLEQTYNELHGDKSRRPYLVVWLPVVDNPSFLSDPDKERFNFLQSSMPWYSLYHPSLLHSAVIKFIKEVWHFKKKPILVVLDPQGSVLCPNALHMMWIWGSVAFPFTKKREEDLWGEETWRIELLVNGIDVPLLTSIGEGKFICLYGGENITWIRNFTVRMQRVATEAQIPLEMVYVGKKNPRERVRRNVEIIDREKLSRCWADLSLIWFFWVRLESMWFSKMQHGRHIDNDNIMREVMSILTLDSSDSGWAIIGRRAGEMAKASGETMMETLLHFSTWKPDIEPMGFTGALSQALARYHSPKHCTQLILPAAWGKIEEQISCAECGRPMEEFIIYQCCEE